MRWPWYFILLRRRLTQLLPGWDRMSVKEHGCKTEVTNGVRNNCWSEFAYAHTPIRSATARQTDLTVFWSFESCSLNISKVGAPKRLLNQKLPLTSKTRCNRELLIYMKVSLLAPVFKSIKTKLIPNWRKANSTKSSCWNFQRKRLKILLVDLRCFMLSRHFGKWYHI